MQEWLAHRFASACLFAGERCREVTVARGAFSPDCALAVMNAAGTAQLGFRSRALLNSPG